MNIFGWIGLGIALVLVLVLLASCIQIVQQSRAYVVEFLGAFHAVWNVGFHFKVPVVMRIAKKVSLKEQVADFAPQPVITKDNVTMQIDTVIYFQITDPKLYTYGVEHPMNAIENLTATTLRNIIGDMELDQSLTSRDTINTRMRAILDEATDPWGIKVNRVELKNIMPPKDIQDSMEKQMRAERERREAILQAEGQKAIDNLDEILDVPGIDVVFVGPYDLSSSLGHVGEIDHPEVIAAIKQIIAKAAAKGVKIGCFADTVEGGKKWRDMGVKFIGYGCDTYIFMQAAKADVAEFDV